MFKYNNKIAVAWINTIQFSRGWYFKKDLEELEESQWSPIGEIAIQNSNRLTSLLKHCQQSVPFYRDALKSAGFSSTKLCSSEDLHRLPIITKNDLRANYERFKSEENIYPYNIWASSGSTGEPFPFRLDRQTIKRNSFAALSRGKRWWGIEDGMPEGMIWSGLSDLTGTLKGQLAAYKRKLSWSLKNITLVDIYLLDDQAITSAYKLLLRNKIKYIRAIATGLLRFCMGIERIGLDGKKLGIKVAIYTGEGLSKNQRQQIESILGCKTVIEYGCTELGVIAFECNEGSLHINHENLFVEYLVDGKPAKEGERAELVITNLNNYSYPLLRYKIGDFAVQSLNFCKCGRTLPLIKELQGREHDCIQTPKGKTIHGLFFTHIFDQFPQVKQFCIIQNKIDELIIEIVEPEKMVSDLPHAIEQSILKNIAEPIKIVVNRVNFIKSASNGKTKWIVSNIK